MLGIASRSAASRSHGSSARKRSATSYVAPPQHSTRPQLGRGAGDVLGDGEQVARAHPGREQRLVGVAEGGVGDGDPVLGAQPAGELLGADLAQQLAGAVGHGLRPVERRQLARPGTPRPAPSPCGWLTVTSAR